MLPHRSYQFLARPRKSREDERAAGINCRSLVQDYFELRRGLFLSREEVEMPGLWERTGTFVGFEAKDWADLPSETILLGEPIRDRHGRSVDRSPAAFDSLQDYRVRLHTALLLTALPGGLVHKDVPHVAVDDLRPVVLHATAITGSTTVWGLEIFQHYYRVVAAKTVDGVLHAGSDS